MKVELSAEKKVTEFKPEQLSVIIDDLTLPNPLYVQAMKYSGYSTIEIPKYNEYYTLDKSTLYVPRGYKIPFENTEVDNRFSLGDVEYPKLRIQLRDTQKKAVEAYMKGREEGNGVIVLPTGKGKSILGIALSAKLKQRTLVIVHKDDLIDGWKLDCKLALGLRPKQVGLIKGKVFRLGGWITLATIQTLSKLNCVQVNSLKEYFSMIIVDEFHHSAANIYKLINQFPAKDRIGLTATDMRNDGLVDVLTFYFGKVCFRFKEDDNDEDIIAPKDVTVKIKTSNIVYDPPPEYVDMDGRKIYQIKRAGKLIPFKSLTDEEKRELEDEKIIKRKALAPHDIADSIQTDRDFALMVVKDIKSEYLNGKSCLAFCKEKEHVRLLKNLLISIGVPESAIQLYYGDSAESKSSMKEKAESGECLVTIATYAIATEGTNVKRWERLFLAMTFNNEKDTIQAVGRGRRKLEGKKDCIIYDYSHPRVKGASSHINTRVRAYKKLGFKISYDRSIMRGFSVKHRC